MIFIYLLIFFLHIIASEMCTYNEVCIYVSEDLSVVIRMDLVLLMSECLCDCMAAFLLSLRVKVTAQVGAASFTFYTE